MPRTYLLLLLLLLPIAAGAQHADTLREVRVRGKKWQTGDVKANVFAPGQKLHTIDSATLAQYKPNNLATLLAQQSPVFVKSYSFNGLATLSFRGASAAQSQVLWNGVPIQNAALGIADIAAVPVLSLSRVSILYGGSGALYGSGNVGGTLLLESNTPLFDTSYRHLAGTWAAGSFGQRFAALEASGGRRRWYISAKLQMQSARNDFAYADANGSTKKMPNSALYGMGGVLQVVRKTGLHSTAGLHIWAQQYNREIPPALFESRSQKQQADGSLRVLLNWDKTGDKNNWYARTAITHDNTVYDDSAVRLHTNAAVYQYYSEVGWRRQWPNSQLLIYLPVQLAWMRGGADNRQHHQDRVGIAAAYRLQTLRQRMNVALNMRGELVMGTQYALPGASVAYDATQWLTLRASVQRSYRVPTLNELYYFPGGNSSLRAEYGWSQDAGYVVTLQNTRVKLTHDVAVYNRDIHDWILWLGGAVWTPHNIARVRSRGLETDNRVELTTGKVHWYAGLMTAYVLATTQESYLPGDNSTGRQIPYTPRYNVRANAGLRYKALYAGAHYSYTGYRFTVSDESAYLQPYNTLGAQLMYHMHVLLWGADLSAQVNNITDQRYMIVGGRPMPGRNLLLSLTVTRDGKKGHL